MKILLALDGSEYSADAVEAVAARPWPAGTVVRVLSVVKTDLPLNSEISTHSKRSSATENAHELTNRMADWLRSSGHDAETAVRPGDPPSVILDEAREWEADLVVVGSHGRTGIKPLLLGSVAHSVVNQSVCSVEVVRRKPLRAGHVAMQAEEKLRQVET